MNTNRIHQGIDQEMKFKGRNAPFLYYMLGLMLGVILLFLILLGLEKKCLKSLILSD